MTKAENKFSHCGQKSEQECWLKKDTIVQKRDLTDDNGKFCQSFWYHDQYILRYFCFTGLSKNECIPRVWECVVLFCSFICYSLNLFIPMIAVCEDDFTRASSVQMFRIASKSNSGLYIDFLPALTSSSKIIAFSVPHKLTLFAAPSGQYPTKSQHTFL